MVVFSHCLLIKERTPIDIFHLDSDEIFKSLELFLSSLGMLAVATFSLISGYFFYLKESFTWSFYRDAIFKRRKSLLYPYLIWNALMFIALWLKNHIAMSVGFQAGVNEVELNILNNYSILDCLLLPINQPLWYILRLIAITLISPLIGLSFKVLKKWAILPLIFMLVFPAYLPFFGTILAFFYFGAYLSKQKIDLIAFANRFRLSSWLGIICYFLNRELLTNGYVESISLIFSVLWLINLVAYMEGKSARLYKLFALVAPATFFVYASHHILLINLVRGVLYTTAWSGCLLGRCSITFITAFTVIVVFYSLFFLLRRLAPRILAFACGGRA